MFTCFECETLILMWFFRCYSSHIYCALSKSEPVQENPPSPEEINWYLSKNNRDKRTKIRFIFSDLFSFIVIASKALNRQNVAENNNIKYQIIRRFKNHMMNLNQQQSSKCLIIILPGFFFITIWNFIAAAGLIKPTYIHNISHSIDTRNNRNNNKYIALCLFIAPIFNWIMLYNFPTYMYIDFKSLICYNKL